MTRKMPGAFEDAVRKAKAALESEGFLITGEFRLDRALKKSLGADFRRYAVISSFFPPLTHKALMVDTEIWPLLPGQFVLHEDEENSVSLSVIDPVVAMSVIENPALSILAREMREIIEKVMNALE